MVGKFKVGDIVRIKNVDEMLTEGGEYNSDCDCVMFNDTVFEFNKTMFCFCGKLVKIKVIDSDEEGKKVYKVSLVNEIITANDGRTIESFYFTDEFLAKTSNTNNNVKNETVTEDTKTVLFIDEYNQIEKTDLTKKQIELIELLERNGFLCDTFVYKILNDIKTME